MGHDITVAPSRARGLKQRGDVVGGRDDRRALTGAWIETTDLCPESDLQQCRALTGAWIETKKSDFMPRL